MSYKIYIEKNIYIKKMVTKKKQCLFKIKTEENTGKTHVHLFTNAHVTGTVL